MTNIQLPHYIEAVLERFHANGHSAYVVGGCVRNMYLGLPPHDYDITTSALPDETALLFGDTKQLTIGKQHGTVSLLLPEGTVEITTMRLDSGYSDMRHPDSVEFTESIEVDLARRDFTANAMAFSPRTGLVDCYGGRADIDSNTLRAVGDPAERFWEDPLRILRAMRFASEYGFVIEPSTESAMLLHKHELSVISPERVRDEFTKLLLGKYAGTVVKLYHEIIAVFVPEIARAANFQQKSRYHCYDVLTHIATTIDNIKSDKLLRLCMFFHDIGKPFCYTEENGRRHYKGHAYTSRAIAEKALRALRYDNHTRENALFLIEHHDYPLTKAADKTVRRWLMKFGEERLIQLCYIHIADDLAKVESVRPRVEVYKDIIKTAKRLVAADECFSLQSLAVDGNDLTALGYSGKAIGDTLDYLLKQVVNNNIENERDTLLALVEKREDR